MSENPYKAPEPPPDEESAGNSIKLAIGNFGDRIITGGAILLLFVFFILAGALWVFRYRY